MDPILLKQVLSTLKLLIGVSCFAFGAMKLFRASKMKNDPAFAAGKKAAIKFLFVGVVLLGFGIFHTSYDNIVIDARSLLPPENSMAPGFTLPNQEGRQMSLGDFKGKWVVLYFYPKDFTSGCSVEAHNFQEDLAKYVARNATIVGVSVDEQGSHKSFCAKEGLNFTLLSDTDHHVITLYGSKMNLGGITLAARNTFLIDPKGIIRKTYPNVSPAKHSEEVLGDLERLEK